MMACPWRYRKSNSGYVLLMVVVLLTILVSALSGVATRSFKAVQQANFAEAQLQQRWGVTSCQEALLMPADRIFRDRDQAILNGRLRNQGPAHLMADIVFLGGQRFDLVLADESAKANLNKMYHLGGYQKMDRSVRGLLPPGQVRAWMPRPAVASAYRPGGKTSILKPEATTDDAVGEPIASQNVETSGLTTPAFRSWGEVFDFRMLAGLHPKREIPLDFSRDLTLWGNGQVNIYRASDAVIQTMAEMVVPAATAKRLVKSFRSLAKVDIQAILEKDISRVDDRRKLNALFGEFSFTYSLFIDSGDRTGRVRRLMVTGPDVDGSPQTMEFVFH